MKTQNGNSTRAGGTSRSPNRIDAASSTQASGANSSSTGQASPVISQRDQLLQKTEEAMSLLSIDEDGKGNLNEIVAKVREMKNTQEPAI